MDTKSHDPAWENWLKGKELRDKWQRQSELIHKFLPIIVITIAIAIAIVTTSAKIIFN